MTIPTAANLINPTESAKKVKRNIFLLSLFSLTSTKMLVLLEQTKDRLSDTPFDLLPTDSVFTFLFSWLFVHNKSFIYLLLICLAILSIRSALDYIMYERHLTKPNKEHLLFLNRLLYTLYLFDIGNLPQSTIPKEYKKKLTLSHAERKNLTKENLIPALFTGKKYDKIKNECETLADQLSEQARVKNAGSLTNDIGGLVFAVSNLANSVQQLINEYIQLAIKESYQYFLSYCFNFMTIGFGVITFFYCLYTLTHFT